MSICDFEDKADGEPGQARPTILDAFFLPADGGEQVVFGLVRIGPVAMLTSFVRDGSDGELRDPQGIASGTLAEMTDAFNQTRAHYSRNSTAKN